MSQPAPGPYGLELTDDVSYIRDAQGALVAEVSTWMQPQAEATARLLTAAPLFLTACRGIDLNTTALDELAFLLAQLRRHGQAAPTTLLMCEELVRGLRTAVAQTRGEE